MTTAHHPLTLWLVATVASVNVHPASDSDRRPVLVVVLHNYASIAPDVLGDAAREVERTYAQLGIGVRWMAVPLDIAKGDDGRDEVIVATIHVRLFRRDSRDAHLMGNVAMTPDALRPAMIVWVRRAEIERLQRGESPFAADQADRIRAGVRATGR
jgi:hypothetical protein